MALLDAHISPLQAEEDLRDFGHEMTPQGLYDTILASGGTEKEASRAASKRVLQMTQKG